MVVSDTNFEHRKLNMTMLLRSIESKVVSARLKFPQLAVVFNVFYFSFCSQVFTMDCYFRQVWTDKRLVMNVSDTNFEYIQLNIKILELIWFPDTVFYNGKKSYLHTITTPNRFIRIYRDGRVLLSQRSVFHFNSAEPNFVTVSGTVCLCQTRFRPT